MKEKNLKGCFETLQSHGRKSWRREKRKKKDHWCHQTKETLVTHATQ
jgi:hypothetical protein